MNATLGPANTRADPRAGGASSAAPGESCFTLNGRECVVVREPESPEVPDSALAGRDRPGGQRQVLGELCIDGETYLVVARESPDPAGSEASGPSAAELLTPRELQIAMYVAEGLCDKGIAREIKVSPFTVASRRRA